MEDDNGWTTRLGVMGLAATVVITIVAAAAIIISGHEVPQGFFNIGTTAVGALAALLYSSHIPQATVTKGPGPNTETLKVS